MRSFFVKLQSEYEQITQNQIGRLEAGLSRCEVVSGCKKITENIRIIRADIENILKEYLYPMIENIHNISDEDEEDLFLTAQKISSYEFRIDPGLALIIYQKLLERAREKKDEDKILKYLYWCGLTLYFFRKEQEDKILAYFEEGASYMKKYHSIEDPETRKYIHRCLGNQSMMLYSINECQKAIELDNKIFSFWNGIIFSGKDLDFPWLNYFLSCLNHRYSSMSKHIHTDPDSETKEGLQNILKTAISINKLYMQNRGLFSVFGGTRYEYFLWEAQFLSGLISFEQLRENINKRKEETLPDDYSANALYIRVQLDSYLMFYASNMQRLKDKKNEVINVCMKNITDYFSMIPMTVKPTEVNDQLQLFISNLSGIFKPEEQLNFILKMTTFRHIPTYAHSIIVGKIASYLTEFLAKKNPGCFVGCMNITKPEDTANHIGELRRFAEIGGLCHDIGKITYINNPFMHARILTKDEFEIVKAHPVYGHKMMAREDGASFHEGYSDIILGHHKYFDNSGGYPDDFDIDKSKYRTMINIIAIADSIDSATDDIGKTYTDAKSLETVCAEIKTESGSRYSPEVASLLEDCEVKELLARILNEDRPNAYYTAYLHAWNCESCEN